jgi:hypothetical protein
MKLWGSFLAGGSLLLCSACGRVSDNVARGPENSRTSGAGRSTGTSANGGTAPTSATDADSGNGRTGANHGDSGSSENPSSAGDGGSRVDPSAVSGCRSPTEPGCSTCCTSTDNQCIAYKSSPFGETGSPWYNESTLLRGDCLAGCAPCASCSLHDEEALKALGCRAQCKCDSIRLNEDPCMIPDSCQCYCSVLRHTLKRCPGFKVCPSGR